MSENVSRLTKINITIKSNIKSNMMKCSPFIISSAIFSIVLILLSTLSRLFIFFFLFSFSPKFFIFYYLTTIFFMFINLFLSIIFNHFTMSNSMMIIYKTKTIKATTNIAVALNIFLSFLHILYKF